MCSARLFALIKNHCTDVLIAVVIASAMGVVSCICANAVDPTGFWQTHSIDVWFGADTARVVWDMTCASGIHSRTSVHPLFTLFTYPQVFVLRELCGLPAITAVRLVIAAAASVFSCTLYTLLRLIGCRKVDATLFCVSSIISGSAIFGLAVPETYVFGAVGVVMALALVAVAERRQVSDGWFVAASALTLSATSSNWLVGILATAVHHNWKKTLKISGCALCVVVVLSAVQKVAFPTSTFFIPSQEECRFLNSPTISNFKECSRVFMLFTMVVPSIKQLNRNSYYQDFVQLSIQHTSQSELSSLGLAAALSWVLLLGLGTWAVVTSRTHSRLRAMLLISTAYQFALHIAYGSETFLYSMHFMPLLVVLAAWSTLTKVRIAALSLAICLILSAGFNNVQQLLKTAAIVNPSALAPKRLP
jgi:hypothetical protein